MPTISLSHGRLCIFVAAILWSTSGFFAKVLSQPTWFGLNEPEIPVYVLAFWRVFFAGLFLVPTLKKRDISFRGLMLLMGIFFGLMNASYVFAMVMGSAANAILLQYTAPMWMYLGGIWLLGEKPKWRSSLSLMVGLTGIAVIVIGSWQGGDPFVVLTALFSGLMYASIVLCLRLLRDSSSRWLTVWNHLGGALFLLPFILREPFPTLAQIGFIFLFGAFQLGLPYFLMARGLRVVSPSESGAISLIEPILVPVWAYLTVGEAPGIFSYIGGVLILGSLAWRYWPQRRG